LQRAAHNPAILNLEAAMSESIYDIPVTDIHGKAVKLAEYKDKVLLVVNVASKCGFTPQYKGLEALYEKLHARGLEVLGFPCNQFGAQEPGSEDEIANFCELNYGVTFPLFAKIDVNGGDAAPLYQHLKKARPGLLGSEAIKWNFTKFLVDRKGNVVERYAPNVEPQAIAEDIEKLL
jgi:glutathione peroxidase